MSRLDLKPSPGASCPFLCCPRVGDHSHPVCDECKAVNFGNLTCLTCRTSRWKYDQEIAAAWRAIGEPEIAAGFAAAEPVN